MPTVPVNAAGWRIDPPVSDAVAARQRSAETAVADPPDDPPAVSFTFDPLRRHGLDSDPGWVPWFGRIVAFHFVTADLLPAPEAGRPPHRHG